MKHNDEYFKGVSFIKLVFLILFFFGAMVLIGQVKAQTYGKVFEHGDNETEAWNTQIIYDTTIACYQGTLRWIVMANPLLIGQQPPLPVQRQMIEHCFCVMDKLRTDYPIQKYIEMIQSGFNVGELFMNNAYKCMQEFDTLRNIIQIQPDNATKSDNSTIIKPDKPKDSQDEPPGQEPKESENGLPDTLFQG